MPGDSLVRGPDPTMVLNGTNRLLVCSFSGSYEVCQYSIRVTEVFIGGTYNVSIAIKFSYVEKTRGYVVCCQAHEMKSSSEALISNEVLVNTSYILFIAGW